MLVYLGLNMYIHLGVSLAKNKITSFCYWIMSVTSTLILFLFMSLELYGGLVF